MTYSLPPVCPVCHRRMVSLGTDPSDQSKARVTCGSNNPECMVLSPVYLVSYGPVATTDPGPKGGRPRLELTDEERATRRKEQVRGARRAHYARHGK